MEKTRIGGDVIMNIPLSMETFVDRESDRQMVTIWSNGKKVTAPAPITPYFFSMRSLEFDMAEDIVEIKETVRLLSTLKEAQVYKYEVPNIEYIKEINKSLNRGGLDAHQRITQAVFENHIKYIDRILIDKPDFALKYPNSDELRFFYFDIETLMDNYMDLKTITSIAYASNDREVHSKQGNEKEILQWFLDSVQSVDPDVLVGYYMKDFDLTRIIDRCKVHNLDYTKLARNGKAHYFKGERDRNVTMRIGGRVLWDLLDSVNNDQTIYGIKNKKMKTVCEWFGIEGSDWVKVPMTNSANDVDEATLRSHNEDDIRRTFGLADIYWGNISTLAEMFRVPLDYVINNTQASLAGIFMGRGLLNLNIRSDGMNQDRHPEIFRRPNKVKGEGNYEAAMVGIYQPGLHKPLYKIDFAGFYPSLMAAFNLSPDTTKVLGYKPYQDKFTSEVIGNKVVYYIPDKVIKKTVIIGVKQDVDGFLRKELRQIREERNKIKKAYKTASPEEKDILNSRQWALKVMQNIPSGLNGSAISRYGDIGTTIPTVGIGSELLKDLKDHIDEEKPICIESDTDGLYLSEKPNMDKINKFLEDLIATKFNLKESAEISLDLDEYAAGYFIKMKNYILQNLNGDLTYHGAGMKSSRLPGIFDSAKDILCEALLSGETELKPILNRLCDLDQYNLGDFTLRTTLHKKLLQYKPGALQRKLGDQAKAIGMVVEPETQMEYVKVNGGYRIIQATNSIKEIDKEYYIGVIEKLATALGMEQSFKTRQIRTLDAWW